MEDQAADERLLVDQLPPGRQCGPDARSEELLVEGRTEKLVFPFIFQALGHDHDREAISIVECGGKSNIPLFARICEATRIPYLVVHDRDAPPGKRPIQAERAVNQAIATIAGRERTIELAPDFEAVAGLRGHSHKPERAWRGFAGIEPARVPAPLAEAVRRIAARTRLSRGGAPGHNRRQAISKHPQRHPWVFPIDSGVAIRNDRTASSTERR